MVMTLKSWHFVPRSLRQLVLLAFVLVLLPLLILAWQAWESFSSLSEQAAETNRNTFTDVRLSELMARSALEIERNYRQFCVLNDPTLESLYQQQYLRYQQMASTHFQRLPQLKSLQKIQHLLPELSQLRCDQGNPREPASDNLIAFSIANSQLVDETRQRVFTRGLELQHEIADRGAFFGWQALLLFLISLVFMLLFTRMIIGPVKNLKQMIHRLGEGGEIDATTDFRGPDEIRSLGQRIVWLSERLSWLEAQRHEFLRHLSHELKTPLASLREGSALLKDEVSGPLNSEQKEIVAILDQSSLHLQTLIEQLLDYNRHSADSGGGMITVDLQYVIDGVVSAHALPASARNIETEIALEEQYCLADRQLLARTLDNLYSNAINYGKPGGWVVFTSSRQGDKVWIDVSNSGTPIPEHEQKMIFEPFYQGARQRRGPVKGSGLGLSIAKDCIQRMQGELTLVNKNSSEVCFRIELPLINGTDRL